jgi:hypothetical protein
MSALLARMWLWTMVGIGALVPHIRGIVQEGISRYLLQVTQEVSWTSVLVVELWMISPYLIIAGAQPAVRGPRANIILVRGCAVIAIISLVLYSWFYRTWVFGLVVLVHPGVCLALAILCIVRALRLTDEL